MPYREVWMQVRDPGLIRRWRKQKRYSQRELAFLVRRSQATIWQIEDGRLRSISEDLALAIAVRLEVPWEELFVAQVHEPASKVESDANFTQRMVAQGPPDTEIAVEDVRAGVG